MSRRHYRGRPDGDEMPDINRAFIGIEDNKPAAIALLNQKIQGTNIRVEAPEEYLPPGG